MGLFYLLHIILQISEHKMQVSSQLLSPGVYSVTPLSTNLLSLFPKPTLPLAYLSQKGEGAETEGFRSIEISDPTAVLTIKNYIYYFNLGHLRCVLQSYKIVKHNCGSFISQVIASPIKTTCFGLPSGHHQDSDDGH